jgi:hypothetical protein
MVSLCVIEIKKGDINSHTLAQCLRYIRDLKGIYLHTRHPDDPDDASLYRKYKDATLIDEAVGIPFEITGMLIGYEIPDKNILTASEAAGIEVGLYDYDENADYSLSIGYGNDTIQRHETYSQEAYSLIGNAIHEVIQRRLAVQLEGKEGDND